MPPKPITKGGPRPDIKDYQGLPNGQSLFEADVAKWQKLNVGSPETICLKIEASNFPLISLA